MKSNYAERCFFSATQTKLGDYLLFGSFIVIIYPMHEDVCSLSEAVHQIS
jgi:hypothetical protein